MSDNQIHEQRRFAIEGIKNTGFYYTKSLVDGKYKLPILYCLQQMVQQGIMNFSVRWKQQLSGHCQKH